MHFILIWVLIFKFNSYIETESRIENIEIRILQYKLGYMLFKGGSNLHKETYVSLKNIPSCKHVPSAPIVYLMVHELLLGYHYGGGIG